MIERYSKLSWEQGSSNLASWFTRHRDEIEAQALGPFAQAASLSILVEYERAPECVEALGALNRWPKRSAVPIDAYLAQWQESCDELKASPQLPDRLQQMLGIKRASR